MPKSHGRSRSSLILVGLIAAAAPVPLRAAIVYWDLNADTAGSGGPTPNGNWDAAASNWNQASDGTGLLLAPWVAGDTAVFSAGSDATGEYTVTVASTQTAAGMTIEDGIVNIAGGAVATGAGPIVVGAGATLSTNSSLRVSTTAGSTLTLNGGTLRTTNAGAAGTFFDIDTQIILGAGGGTLSHVTANILNIVQTASTISGSGSLTKSGAGVLAFALDNPTWTGATIINDGELRIRTAGNNRLPATTAVTVTSPGILNLNTVNLTIGSLAGSGNVGTGAGILTMNPSTDTFFTGALKNIANAGAGAVTTGNGKLVKNGTGVITFAGLNDISGSVTLNAGGIIVSPGASLAGSIADITVNGGTLTLNNAAQTIENLAGTGGSIALAAGHTLTISPVPLALVNYSGAITGAGSVTKLSTATEVFAGTNTYTGATKVNAGSLLVSGSLSASSAITVGDATALATAATFGGSGTVGAVTATGSGDPTTSGAIVDPGNTASVAGILKSGVFSITNGAHLGMQIGGSTAGGESTTGYDQVVAGGAVSLTGGDLQLTLQGTPTLAPGTTLYLVVNNSGTPVTGAFSTLNNASFSASNFVVGGQGFQLTYSANFTGAGSDGIANDVALVAVPEPGAFTAILGGMAVLAGFRRSRSSYRA